MLAALYGGGTTPGMPHSWGMAFESVERQMDVGYQPCTSPTFLLPLHGRVGRISGGEISRCQSAWGTSKNGI